MKKFILILESIILFFVTPCFIVFAFVQASEADKTRDVKILQFKTVEQQAARAQEFQLLADSLQIELEKCKRSPDEQ